jgi:acyl carrier protein
MISKTTDIKKEAIHIIAFTLKVPEKDIDLNLEIGDLPEWDSIHHLQIINELEKTFCIHFQQEELADCENVSDLISLIEEIKN